jgi:hypothetical protein
MIRSGYAEVSMRRLVAFVVVLLALVPQVAMAGGLYRCRFDERMRSTCCCEGPAGTPSSETQIGMACCCDVVRPGPPGIQARSESALKLRAAAWFAVTTSAVDLTPPSRPALAPVRKPVAPHAAEPLYIRNASLLL